MVLLGLLLIMVAAAAVIEISINETATTMPVTIWDWTVNLSPLELFAAGAATAVVFLVGLLMVSGGLRRSSTKRRKVREARLAERQRLAQLEAEKRDLERKLEGAETPATATATGPAPDPATGSVTSPVAGPVTGSAAERDLMATRDADVREADTREMTRPGRVERDRTDEPPGSRVTVPAQSSSDQLVAGRRGTPRSDHSGDPRDPGEPA
ncbi:hypothetical protein GCM10023194_69250 [Planotetraspora phitsanulokensis]|uniref:Lipopolysaccharide assembly protein A domain-containing protein n=1 Tax=Planotetraspora phitsanulokensis TaxID=575192 RepID=A0A8J3U7F7_9ACTN|nr:hypothetical protein [Planotetraspora phitsanulokensis]GII39512.1 hypothetical protein Pph01_45150 [Planotetraspora phitsanulokensis]